MSANPRLIRRRIKSVGNTKKITKAMELVSAAKMRRATSMATSARRYAFLGNELLKSISLLGVVGNHAFFKPAISIKKVLCLVIASDRGLCGSYNASLMRAVDSSMLPYPEVDYIAVGRQAELALRRSGKNIIASFNGLTDTPRAVAVRPVVSLIRSEFISGIYDQVFVATTHFQSALRQTPNVFQFLPIAPLIETKKENNVDALFEPMAETVLEYTLPRFLESGIYQAVLEAAASEHSARMMSMRSATDAAGEMIQDLTFVLNQARQSAITSEIAEISAGRAALEG